MPEHLLRKNREWAAQMVREDPNFFSDLINQQSPRFLWIGCSDSRVPANQITGLAPGEVFVHRNVGNLVIETDFNVMAVIEYAVEVLKVSHIIVCGHYGCGGVRAALDNYRHGMIDNWLSGLRSLYRLHQEELEPLSPEQATDRLCELNVMAQARNVARTTILEKAWEKGQEVSVHSWIYRLDQGIITPLAEPIGQAVGFEGLPASLLDYNTPDSH